MYDTRRGPSQIKWYVEGCFLVFDLIILSYWLLLQGYPIFLERSFSEMELYKRRFSQNYAYRCWQNSKNVSKMWGKLVCENFLKRISEYLVTDKILSQEGCQDFVLSRKILKCHKLRASKCQTWGIAILHTSVVQELPFREEVILEKWENRLMYSIAVLGLLFSVEKNFNGKCSIQ